MRPWVTTVLDFVGAALIVAGIALVFVPAALAVAGLALLAISWRASR
ncbi:hypothetical protein [Pseudarthrobacter sp. CCNWLW207]